jgi:uncharacterized protein (TIGR03067 family)
MRSASWKIVAAAALVGALLAGGVGAVVYRGPADKEAKKSDRPAGDSARIQGTWKVEALERGGKKPKGDEGDRMMKARWVIDGKTINVKIGDESRESHYKLYPDRKPPAIDVTSQVGGEGEKGKLFKGIYVLDGDTLKVCMAHPGDERPAKVESKEGTTIMLIVLKRVKAGK